ncbi:MAG: glutamate racemase [Lentisphaeria bacterium]|nr:glutamate racemase [Lentisphaeria bacterium]
MTSFRDRAVGVFDSGLGGLTVAAAIRRILPEESVIYLGDTARLPYGNRSPETVRAFAAQDLAFLLKQGVKTVIAACNTVSSEALDDMQRAAGDVPVSGVILPGVREAVRSGARSMAVLGTRGTIRSGIYERELHKLDPSLKIRSIACPLFVPLAEEGVLSGPAAERIAELYLGNLLADPPELIIPGCTHYPLLRETILSVLPRGVRFADCASACARELKEFLERENLTSERGTSGDFRLCVTDLTDGFRIQAENFLGSSPGPMEKVSLS